MTTTTATEVTAPPGDREFVLIKYFDASPARVFKAYTDPELIPRWWGPARYATTVDVMETRHGGRWRFVQRDDEGNEHAFRGIFHEVIDDERITWTFEYEGAPGHIALETVTFEPEGDGTRLTAKSVHQSVIARDAMLQTGAESGMRETMERLTAVISEQTA